MGLSYLDTDTVTVPWNTIYPHILLVATAFLSPFTYDVMSAVNVKPI